MHQMVLYVRSIPVLDQRQTRLLFPSSYRLLFYLRQTLLDSLLNEAGLALLPQGLLNPILLRHVSYSQIRFPDKSIASFSGIHKCLLPSKIPAIDPVADQSKDMDSQHFSGRGGFHGGRIDAATTNSFCGHPCHAFESVKPAHCLSDKQLCFKSSNSLEVARDSHNLRRQRNSIKTPNRTTAEPPERLKANHPQN